MRKIFLSLCAALAILASASAAQAYQRLIFPTWEHGTAVGGDKLSTQIICSSYSNELNGMVYFGDPRGGAYQSYTVPMKADGGANGGNASAQFNYNGSFTNYVYTSEGDPALTAYITNNSLPVMYQGTSLYVGRLVVDFPNVPSNAAQPPSCNVSIFVKRSNLTVTVGIINEETRIVW